jgi:threonylcarbamoyladenosine tRNA methylthiotransferase MtaB
MLGDSKRVDFYTQFIGQKLDVLIETTRHRLTGLLKGLSSNYIPILIDANNDYKNKLVAVRAQKLADDILLGTILS